MLFSNLIQFQSTLRRTERLRIPGNQPAPAYFNPRSDERSDQWPPSHTDALQKFQSTLRRTERRYPPLTLHNQTHFNPRSDERSDKVSRETFFLRLHFNPRSDERSDQRDHVRVVIHKISIHAPTNGATLFVNYNIPISFISIHAPTNGATSINADIASHEVFQSTLRRTERLTSLLMLFIGLEFQSTLRRTERLTQL